MEEYERGDLDFDVVRGSETNNEVSFSNHDFIIIMKCRLRI